MKKLLLTLALMGIVPLLHAQESSIDPGSQAQGYLNSKNMSVDHVTGTFHYRVPLHEIKTGGFALPITLDYTARGVKAEDKPGIVGYGWNLNAGGVVTRIVRGGIPDEYIPPIGSTYPIGAMQNDMNTTVRSDEASAGYCDGESDIFTAVFNGRSVSFIIQLKDKGTQNQRIVAVPLEPTNVYIDCVGNPGVIGGWNITDEAGNQYYYSEKEINHTIRQKNVSSNNIDQRFRSSWYLTSIRTANGSLITFEYGSWINQEYPSQTEAEYCFGRPIVNHPMDFSKYANLYQAKINLAKEYIGNFCSQNLIFFPLLDEQIALLKFPFSFGQTWNTYYYLDGIGALDLLNYLISQDHFKYNGLRCDLQNAQTPYDSAIATLTRIRDDCRNSVGISHPATLYTQDALDLVVACRDEIVQEHSRKEFQRSCTSISTPKLSRISYDDRIIEFTYDNTDWQTASKLAWIRIKDLNANVLRSIRMDRNPETLLANVTYFDKTEFPTRSIRLDYYNSQTDKHYINHFGYYTSSVRATNDSLSGRKDLPMDNTSLHNTLCTIHLSKDAQIDLQYDFNNLVGGIKIRRIQILDKISGTTDNVAYQYGSGYYIYPQITKRLGINHAPGFSDYTLFDRIINDGPDAIVKFGNNGMYYSSVTEEFEGKSRTDYYFKMPDTSNPIYNYWNIGDPLGIVYYDTQLDKTKIVRYEYDDQLALSNRKLLYQAKPIDYYYDPNEMRMSAGDPASQYFQDNIYYRLNPVFDFNRYQYRISCNYDSYLKRIKTYYFDGSIQDYRAESSRYSITEYDYDLSKSTMPVKTTVTNSDGTKYIETVKRALDFNDGADASIPLLKARNIVGPPLKVQAKIVTPAGVEKLLAEKVNQYANYGSVQVPQMFLSESYEYRYNGTDVETSGALFGFAKSKYDKTTLGYGRDIQGYKLFPVSITNAQGRKEMVCDYFGNEVILAAVDNPANSVAACNFKRGLAYPKQVLTLLNAPSLKYKLYVIANLSASQQVTLTINGSTPRNFTLSAGKSGPQVFDLDLTGVTIQQIKMTSSDQNIAYIALVPADCPFEATSYNADGTMYCKFDQSGQMERYEYDNAGRMIKVFDKDGKLLKENTYNIYYHNM